MINNCPIYSVLPKIPIKEGEKVLDAGCGLAKTPNAIGIDLVNLPGVDIIYDLNKMPWPFGDNEFDWVIMNDILEHLDDPPEIIKEVYRILKKEGKLCIRVLYWNHKYNYSDPQHKHVFTEVYFEFFCGMRRPYYMDYRFSKLDVQYTFDNKAVDTFGNDRNELMRLSYFNCNIINGMHVILTK